MAISTFTSRDFNHDVSKIKKASATGPVFITDRGRPAHVLLTIKDYLELSKTKDSIVDLLAMPDSADIEFEPTKIKGNLYHIEDID